MLRLGCVGVDGMGGFLSSWVLRCNIAYCVRFLIWCTVGNWFGLIASDVIAGEWFLWLVFGW